jgi:hypothetical protein
MIFVFQSNKKDLLLQPIIVRAKGEYFEIVVGNRRYNACISLCFREIYSLYSRLYVVSCAKFIVLVVVKSITALLK